MGKPIYEHGSKEVSQFTLIGAAIWLLENEQLFKPAADRFKNLLQSRDDFFIFEAGGNSTGSKLLVQRQSMVRIFRAPINAYNSGKVVVI